ncbi:unnamed protein product [Adineta steineri]|uniref:Zinc-binding loop region of homing endonuclease domain-containing protein n=1 Tax=Adineta steineri TaxID=433720 RepID=A0A815RHH6_9BILA|nr:unnamed protein product [Adineta steineri]CAF1637052.1 unnamed protein product [Adineta steineri]
MGLNDDQATLLMEEMLEKDECIEDINGGHVSGCITKEELWKMTSSEKEPDGIWFEKWMTCHIAADYAKSKATYRAAIDLCRTGHWPKDVQDIIKLFLDKKSFIEKRVIKSVHLHKSHIILRSQYPSSFTGLSRTKNENCASHFCDIAGCIRPEHLVIETTGVNNSRYNCEGVTLFVRLGSETSPGHIIQATPCPHGLNSGDQGLKNSCRKLKIYAQDQVSIDYFVKKNKKFVKNNKK